MKLSQRERRWVQQIATRHYAGVPYKLVCLTLKNLGGLAHRRATQHMRAYKHRRRMIRVYSIRRRTHAREE